MGRLIVLSVTVEQELAIKDLFSTRQWQFNDFSNLLSKDLENELLSAWKQSLTGVTDDCTGKETDDIKTQRDQSLHVGDILNLRNENVFIRQKNGKPLINHTRQFNLRSKKFPNSNNLDERAKQKGRGHQQISITTEENLETEQVESRILPECENKKVSNVVFLGINSDNVMDGSECGDEGNVVDFHVIKSEDCSEVINHEKEPVVTENDNCSKNAKTNIELKDVAKKTLKCEECSYTTNIRSNLNRHTKEIHSGERHKCCKCSKTFKGKHDAKMHQLYSHTSGFQCKQCDKSFSSISGLRNHVKIIHKKRSLYECEHCNMKFYYKSHYLGHLNKHLNLKPFACKTCEKPFRYKIACHLHEKTCCHDNFYTNHNFDGSLKEEIKSKYLCDICGKEVSSKSSLKSHHYYTHLKDTTTVCAMCGKCFKGQYSLQRHIRNTHEDTDVRYTCSHCKKEFSQRQIFKQHIKIHEKVYKCTCETCGKGFLSKFKMLEHSRIHTGEKPFTCPYCHTFKSATKTNLQKHMRIHEEGRLSQRQCRLKNRKQKSTFVPDEKVIFEGKSVNEVKSVNESGIKHFESLVEPLYMPLQMSPVSYTGSSQFNEGDGQYTNLHKICVDDNTANYDSQSYRHVYIGEDNDNHGQINFTISNAQKNNIGQTHSRFHTRNIVKNEFVNVSERKNDMKVDSQTEYNELDNGDSYYDSASKEATELSQGLNILTVAMNIVNPSQY